MNHVFAHSLAVEMINKMSMVDDFFGKVASYDNLLPDYKKEYEFAIKSAIVNRMKMEDDKWRERAKTFLAERGIR